jgi:hypothetical protein
MQIPMAWLLHDISQLVGTGLLQKRNPAEKDLRSNPGWRGTVATKVEVPFERLPMLGARAGTRARTCYNCQTSYSDFFRFCPKDGVDLEYAPPRIDDLGRDFGTKTSSGKWKWIGILSLLVPLLILSTLYLGQFVSATTGAGERGELVVKTTPAGAMVYLDGSQVGLTPVRLSDLPAGYHDVRAVYPGYRSGMVRVEIVPSASRRLVLEMIPEKPINKELYIAAGTAACRPDHNSKEL